VGFRKLPTDRASAAADLPGTPSLADQEEHILRCFGAAIIMEWNGLPSAIQRKLFDSASTMGSLLNIVALREGIDRFVQKHQDAEQ
jgi:hypothetical protein